MCSGAQSFPVTIYIYIFFFQRKCFISGKSLVDRCPHLAGSLPQKLTTNSSRTTAGIKISTCGTAHVNVLLLASPPCGGGIVVPQEEGMISFSSSCWLWGVEMWAVNIVGGQKKHVLKKKKEKTPRPRDRKLTLSSKLIIANLVWYFHRLYE